LAIAISGSNAVPGSHRAEPTGRPVADVRRPRPPRPARASSLCTVATTVLDPDVLLAYFAAHGRDLPWRHPEASPWAILVSEVMLQQTPVARVLPVFRDWMDRWPTPAALAGEPAGEAVRAWGRLGYPRRALRLHAAAHELVRRHGGAVPADLEALLALPGVGDYTARAVAAFAFRARVPVIDTNVRRVLSRAVRGVDEHRPASAADRAELEHLLPDDPERAARVSAALMELGALVCTASRPNCAVCPLAVRCRWLAAGTPEGPPRAPGQPWQGTDRQVRGAILARLRDSRHPMAEDTLVVDGVTEEQWRRCLESLVADGLAVRTPAGRLTLPGIRP
jgi:A/G-specific adenine glycosylase